jgi:hypothetical protein
MGYKKHIAALLILFGLNVGCQSNSQIIKVGTEYDYSILKGPVKKMEENTYEPLLKGRSVEKGKLLNSYNKMLGNGGEQVFDEDGNLIIVIQYEEGGKDAKDYKEYEYSEGKLIRFLAFRTASKNVITRKHEYEYDSLDRVYQKQFFEPSYCEDNKWMLTDKDVFEYNGYNDIIKQIDSSFTHYDCDDIRIRARIINRHPKYENELKIEDDTYRYEYDEEGNLIKKFDKNNPPIYYEYYPSGVRKKQFFNEDYYYEYDEDGYYKKSVHSLRSGNEYFHEYSVIDKYGNWTRMIIYEDGKPYVLGEREITYYE